MAPSPVIAATPRADPDFSPIRPHWIIPCCPYDGYLQHTIFNPHMNTWHQSWLCIIRDFIGCAALLHLTTCRPTPELRAAARDGSDPSPVRERRVARASVIGVARGVYGCAVSRPMQGEMIMK